MLSTHSDSFALNKFLLELKDKRVMIDAVKVLLIISMSSINRVQVIEVHGVILVMTFR